jgi:hypothetical protein
LDVLVDVRELKGQISVIKDTPIESISGVEEILVTLEKLRRDLGSIPLPTDLHIRKDQVERASREMNDLLLWLEYSQIFRRMDPTKGLSRKTSS